MDVHVHVHFYPLISLDLTSVLGKALKQWSWNLLHFSKSFPSPIGHLSLQPAKRWGKEGLLLSTSQSTGRPGPVL
jgi:hypothetical protein